MEILIARSGDEIHVSVPFALKDRAKKVSGYRWNPALKVWAFPYTQTIFSELIAEFGDNARVEGFDNATQPSRQPPEPTIQDQLNEKIKNQEALLQNLGTEISDLKVELRGKAAALERLEQHLDSKNSELEKALKQIESLKIAPEEQKLKQGIEYWKRSAADAERKYETLLKETSQSRTAASAPPAIVTSTDPFFHIVSRAINIAGRDRDFEFTVNNTTLSRAPLDLATASEKKLRKSLGIPLSDRRDFIAVIREAAEARVISDEARGLLNFIRQNRNRVAHDQLNQSELWARSCIAILATSIVWPELHGAET